MGDTLKTVAGLIIIGGIVVATFWYGNAQRQTQLAHDREVKQQQQAKAQAQAKTATSSPTASAQAAATPTATPAAKASATPQPTAAPATVPVTGGSGANLPDTGPEMAGVVGLSSIGVMLVAVRRSRQALLKAARNHR